MARLRQLKRQLKEMNEEVGHLPVFDRTQRPVRPPSGGEAGRPEVYDAVRFPHIAKTLCQEYAFTSNQLAQVFGVSVRTVHSWVQKHPEFKAAMQEGKDLFDGVHVENALLRLALGYEYEEKSVKTVQLRGFDAEGNKIRVPAKEITVTTKHMAPNARAVAFWLTNRQSERWKMVTTVNANINANTTHTKRNLSITADMSKMDSAQLRMLRDVIKNQTSQDEIIDSPETVNLLEYTEKAEQILEAEYKEIISNGQGV